jgi:alpha-L-fucosidase
MKLYSFVFLKINKIFIMKRKISLSIAILCLVIMSMYAQPSQPAYQYPTEPEVLQNLHEWQDMKFGLFMHWGTYSQWGIVESWTLCPEDWEWNKRPESSEYFQYVKDYEKLAATFNPVDFNPEKWAAAAKEAGMKYVVFTTKHHDGFNMFDTKQTDYKITGKNTPFHTHPRANVAKETFEAFRKENFKIGAYYSITDWHHNDFWWSYFPPKDRTINYSPSKYPEKWERFSTFINSQLEELISGNYGKLDMMWFDLCGISNEKGVDWERLSQTIHSYQPQTMMVVRGANNQYENYRTPEQEVPEKALDYPWETCMTMGGSWSYKADDEYKPTYQLIQTLVQVVSRGGNFLLNIGPSPEGDFHPTAYQRLKEIGNWMKINGESIYGTKTIAPYHETKIVFTQKTGIIYATYLPDKDETVIPATIIIHSFQPKANSKVYLLGYNKPLSWSNIGKGFVINIPKSVQNNPPCQYGWVFKFDSQLHPEKD